MQLTGDDSYGRIHAEGFKRIGTGSRCTLVRPHRLESEPVTGYSEDCCIGSEVDCREDCHDDTTQNI